MNKSYHHPNFLVCFSILLFILLGFQAKSQSIRISNDTICEGETGFIPVSIVGGQNVAGFSLTILVSNPGITYLGIDSLDPRFSSAQISFDSLNRRWNILWFNLNPVGINGTICRLQLRSLSSAVDSIQWLIANCQLSGPFLSSIPISSYQHGAMVVNPESAPVSISASICAGQQFSLGNQIFTNSGQYSVTLLNQWGCDSLVNLNLHVQNGDTTAFGTLNSGVVYQNDFETHANNWNTGQRHGWNGTTMLGPFSNADIVFQQTNLPVHDSIEVEFDFFIHDSWDNNEQFQFNLNGQDLGTYYFGYWYNSNYSNFTYLGNLGARCWWGGSTRNYKGKFIVPHTAAAMEFRVNVWNAQDPCDESWSIDNFVVRVSNQPYSICQGTPFWVGNQNLTTTGQYSIMLQTSAGCDSLVIVNLKVNPRSDTTHLYKRLCFGESFTYQNQNITNAGIYHFGLVNQFGCDSIVRYQVDSMPNTVLVGSTGDCIGKQLFVNTYMEDWSKIEWRVGNEIIRSTNRKYSSSPTWTHPSSHPAGVFYHQSSRSIFLVETGNHRVVKWSPGSNQAVVVAGGNGAGSGPHQLWNPYDVFVNSSGVIYVSDNGNARVQRWDPGATQGVTVAGGQGIGGGNHQLNQPYGIWVDNLNRVYVADHANNRIMRWNPGSGSGDVYRYVDGPTDILFDQAGNFYSTRYNLHSVLRWPNGSNQAEVAAFVQHPHQITIDLSGNLYVTQHASHQISRFAYNSPREENLGLVISCNPFGIALTDSGSLFVSSHHCGHSLQRFSFEAGTGMDTLTIPKSGNYSAKITRFNGCNVNSSVINVFGETPTLTGPEQQELCDKDTIELRVGNYNSSYQYQWFKNDSIIHGATSMTVRIFDGGLYKVQALTSNNCLISSSTWSIREAPQAYITANCPSNILSVNSSSPNISSIEWYKDSLLVQRDDLSSSHIHTGAWGHNNPRGVFKDLFNNIYVSDTENDRVLKWAPGSSQGVVVAGGNGRGSGLHQLNRPAGIAVNSEGILFVADQFNHRIMAWYPNALVGNVVAGGNGAGNGDHQLNEPYGLILDNQNRILISDHQNHRIMRWELGESNGLRIAGFTGVSGQGPEFLNGPAGIQLTQDRYLWIADMNNHRVQKRDLTLSNSITVAGGNNSGNQFNQLNRPIDIAIDSFGGLHVSDYDNQRVVMWQPGAQAGTVVLQPNQVNGPRGLFFSQEGNLNVVCQGWGDVRKFQKELSSAKVFRIIDYGVYTAKIISNGGCSIMAEGYARIPKNSVLSTRNQEICKGDTAILKVRNEQGFSYQWQKNGIDILGATDTSITVIQPGTYRLKISSGVGCVYSVETRMSEDPTVILNSSGGSACTPGILSIASTESRISGIDWYRDGLFQHRWHPSYDNGSNQTGGLNQPHGIHVDQFGNVYIADSQNDRIIKKAAGTGIITVVAGGNGRGNSLNQLNFPVMVHVDAMGWIYVSDMNNHRIMKWIEGRSQGVVVAGGNGPGSGLHQLYNPHGIWVDEQGRLIISDHSNHRVLSWVPGANQGQIIAGGNNAGNGPSQLNHPCGLFVAQNGRIFIADYHNNRIQAWHPGSAIGETVATGQAPWDVALDGSGTVYFTNLNTHQIIQWQPYAQLGRVVAGINGQGNGWQQLNGPRGLRVDLDNRIWLSEVGRGWLNQFTPENLIGKPYQTQAAGNYSAIARTYSGCRTTMTEPVNFVPTAAINSSHNEVACYGDTLVLNVSQQFGNIYQWQKDGVNIINANGSEYRAVSPGIYRLLVINQVGCSALSREIAIEEQRAIQINTLSQCPNDTTGLYLGITGNNQVLVGMEWYKNGIIHGRQEARYFNSVLQLNQVDWGSWSPGYGWGTNGMNWPHGISEDSQGNIYVADTEFDRIVKYSSTGGQGIVVAGGNGRGSGSNQLNRPLNVYVDERGWIYVSDNDNHRIMRWIPGQSQGVVVAGGKGNGPGLHQLSNPHGVWVSDKGDIYVSDFGNHRVMRWNPGADTGVIVAGGNGNGNSPNQLYHPSGIYLALNGDLYIADNYNHRVQKWSLGAVQGITVAGGNGAGGGLNQLHHPWDVFVVGSGSVYVSDRNNHRIMLCRPGSVDGRVIVGTNGYGNNLGQLNHPAGIRVDKAGRIKISEGGRGWVSVLEHENINSLIYRTSDAGNYTAKTFTNGGCSIPSDNCGLLIEVRSSSGQLLCEGSNTILSGDSIQGCTYQWLRNGNEISGAESFRLVVTQVGEYRLRVTSAMGCTALSCPYKVLPISSGRIQVSGSTCSMGQTGLSLMLPLDTQIVAIDWMRGNEVIKQNQIAYNPIGDVEQGASQYPNHLALGRNGKDLYVSQHNQHRVWKKNLETGDIINVAGMGGYGSGLNQLNAPHGVFVHPNGELFVADLSNHRIMKYEANAISGTVVAGGNGAGSSAYQLNNPYDMWVDASYNVYIVDHSNHRIQKWSPGSTAGITVAGGNGQGSGLNQLNHPTQLAMDANGYMFIVDNHNHRIMRWWPGASSGSIIAGGNGAGSGLNQLYHPHAIQLDPSGTMYISDNHNHRIMRWIQTKPEGQVLFGGLGAGASMAQLTNPQGIKINNDGRIFVSDHGNHRVIAYTSLSLDTLGIIPITSGSYSAKYYFKNGCIANSNLIRLGSDTSNFGSEAYIVQNNFTQNSSGWNTNQRFSYLGNQALGPFANQSLSYFNQNVPPYDTAYFEFDWNIHDSWDNNEPFYVTANGHLLGTFYFWTWGTANYPQLEPLGQSGTRCSGYPTRTYRARFAAPHGIGNNVSFSINQWNAEDVCNESWSIDNFRVTAGRSVTLCQGDTVWMGSMPLVSSGLHRLNLTNQLGCDSVVQAYVQVKPRPADTTIHVQICAGGSYLFGSLNLTQSGRYTRVTTSHNGCDSTIHLELMVHPVYSTQTNRSLCYGQTFGFNGNALTTSGVYTAMLTTSTGCDSMVTLHLTVADSINPTTLVQTLCMGDTLNLQGQTFWQGGSYTVVLTSHTGCDSLVYLDLQVANPSTTVIYDTIAFGSEIWIGNQLINSTGSYSIMLSNNQGCDSLVTVNLVVLNSPLKGVLRYQNSSLTPMGNVLVRLISSNTLIDSALTSGQGYFDFGVRPADTYQLIFFNPRTWGGVNATDALGISRHFTNLQLLNGLKRKAADVNVTTSINSADALLVSRRFSTIINNFNAGDFVYSIDTFSLAQGDSLFLDVRSLCYGDINGSYNPAAITRNSWSRMDEIGDLVTENGVYFLDLKAKRRMDLGAISLNLLLPEGIKVVNVHSASTVSDEPVIFKQLGRNVRIAWHHLMPWVLEEGDAMIRLELMGCVDGWLEIDEAESELANSDGVPLIDLPLIAPRLKAQSLSTIMSASVFPNPTSNRTWLSLAIRQKSSLEIIVMDAIGRQIYQQSLVDVMAGEHRLEIPSDDWSDGHYNVMVQAMNEDGAVLKRNLRLQKRH